MARGTGTKEIATALSSTSTTTTLTIMLFSPVTAICLGYRTSSGFDDESYDPKTGAGSIGVEFAGSAVSGPCPYGQNITMAKADNYSDWLVHANAELQCRMFVSFFINPSRFWLLLIV
jgi:hypothetical protein